jgi:hypothetical protein
MSVGKYSPTVSASYARDQQWWKRHNTDPQSWNDDEGYDSYGYSEGGTGPDRAGYTEDQYASGEDDGCGGWHYPLYERVSMEWQDRLLGDLTATA